MKSILQVFSSSVLSKVLLGALGFILIRFMSEIEFAEYTLSLALVTVVTQVIARTFNRIYIVGYRQFNLESLASSFLGFQLGLIGALAVLMFPVMSSIQGVYWFIVILIISKCLLEFSKTFLQRELKFFDFAVIELVGSSVFFCGLLVLLFFVRYNPKAWQALFIQALSLILVFFLFLGKHHYLNKLMNVWEAARLAVAIIKAEYKYLFGYYAILAFFSQLDIFMLRIMTNDIELATYGSAFRYYSLLLLALGSVKVVFLPLIQEVTNANELKSIFHMHRKMLLMFAPVVLVGAWASQWIIPWIDMGKYPNAVAVFRILAISAIISISSRV